MHSSAECDIMASMKAKTTLIIQTIGMYLMHLPLFVFLVTLPMPSDPTFRETFDIVLLIAFFALAVLMIPVCILNAVVSVKSGIKGEENPAKVTMTAKLSLIPWYILNFAICVVFSSVFFNPFMMLAIPLIVAFSFGMTYILMLTTSLGDIVYFVKKKAKKEGELGAAAVVGIVFLFIFCLDVVGAIILYRQSKKLTDRSETGPTDLPSEQE